MSWRSDQELPQPTSGTDPPAVSGLVLIGASVRAAAESARRAGFRVIGIDQFGDVDTRHACFRWFSLDQAGELIFTLPGFRDAMASAVGGLSTAGDWLDQLAARCPQLAQERQLQLQLDRPALLAKLAADAGAHFPEVLPCRQSPATNQSGDRWLCKKAQRSGGTGIRWADQTQTIARDVPPQPGDQYYQRWIAGRSYGATFLSDGQSCQLLGSCRSSFTRSGSLPFVYCGSLGPLTLPVATVRTLERLGQAVVASTSLAGLFNLDFLLDQHHRVWVLELNARWTASSELIERKMIQDRQIADNDSLFAIALRAMAVSGRQDSNAGRTMFSRQLSESLCSEVGNPGSSRRTASVYWKRVLYARSPLRFDHAALGIDWAQPPAESATLGQCVTVHDVPFDGLLIERGHPVLTLIGRATTIKQAAEQIRLSSRDWYQRFLAYSPRSSANE